MLSRNKSLTLIIILLLSMAWPISGKAADPLIVFVTIAPQQYFVQQIGKDLVDVHVLVEPGENPHTYEPKPKQMVALANAQLYFAIGIEFEASKLEKFATMNPELQVVHTDHGIQKLPMATAHPVDTDVRHEENHKQGQHADDRGHDHHSDPVGMDPHIWLSPPLVMMQARSIVTALQAADPNQSATYEENYQTFMTSLVELDAHLRSMFADFKGSSFMVFHPSWGTFAHTYGLNQVAIELEGKNPKPAQLKELIQYARSNRIKVVFVQPQFSAKSAKEIAKAVDGQVIAVDPMALDWATNLYRVAEAFKHAFNQ